MGSLKRCQKASFLHLFGSKIGSKYILYSPDRMLLHLFVCRLKKALLYRQKYTIIITVVQFTAVYKTTSLAENAFCEVVSL
jgi:hypothetical protein